MKTIITISMDDLSKKFAEYCVTQGWADDYDQNTITLNTKGIEMLSGPPYFFDLEVDGADDVKPVDVSEYDNTFTWYKRNFQPGKSRPGQNGQQKRQDDLGAWKPSLSMPPVDDWKPPADRPINQNYRPMQKTSRPGGYQQQHKQYRPQHQQFKQNPQKNQAFKPNQPKDNTPIKMEVNLPPIARTGYNNKFKKGNFNHKNKNQKR